MTKRSGRAAALLVASITLAAACSSDSSSSSTTTTGAPTTDAATTTTTVTSTAPSTTTATPPTDTTIDPSLYRADITRTEYGIPHIVADDWGSLGFGQGYAFAQDRACTLIDQVIKVRGERAAWFGPGDDDEYVNSDFAYRHLGLHDDADERFANQPEQIAEMVAGYVAGFNAELDEEGPHGWCEGEPWVQPITTTDLYAYLNDVVLFASS
ncbi:MAG TPA: penicillin acylase family protein, partial [Ilumatobacteraceae bacterium]|nr:penicillin acylase family protein [Ilumatobacteraceae bacterium]